MSTITKAALAVIKDGKILMARYHNNPIFYFVGGQVQANETDEVCLRRKVPDEICATVITESLQLLNTFDDVADGRIDTKLVMTLYLGKLAGEIKPNHDVSEIRFFDESVPDDQVSAIAHNKILPWLKLNNYIK